MGRMQATGGLGGIGLCDGGRLARKYVALLLPASRCEVSYEVAGKAAMIPSG